MQLEVNVQKVRLVYGSVKSENKSVIDNMYNGVSAEAISGSDDGVYVITNFPKDVMYKVGSSDTVDTLAKKGFVANSDDIFLNNVIIKECNCGTTYIVSPMDTIDKICSQFGLDVAQMVKINNLKTKKLFVGQRLIVDSQKIN